MTAPLWHLDWLRDRYGIRHIRIPRLQLFWRERRRPVAAPHHPQVKPVPQKRLTRVRAPHVIWSPSSPFSRPWASQNPMSIADLNRHPPLLPGWDARQQAGCQKELPSIALV